jgi:hypothetical protein
VHDFIMKTATHLTGAAVLDKFRMNTEAILGKDQAANAIALVQRLEEIKDVAEVLDAVTRGAGEMKLDITTVKAAKSATVAG